MAARNNADWYAAMFDVHDLRYERSTAAFRAIDTPPPYFSWMTILEPVPSQVLLDLVTKEASRSEFGLKDSFHTLDLESLGLTELFTATWIWASETPGVDSLGWHRVTSIEDLSTWEQAWKDGGSPSDQRQFPDSVLDRQDLAFWGRASGSGFDAGAVANLSLDCVGMSNVFGSNAMPAAAMLCAGFGPGLPVVGYEHGDGLAEALEVGFEPVGHLRVCGKQEERPTSVPVGLPAVSECAAVRVRRPEAGEP